MATKSTSEPTPYATGPSGPVDASTEERLLASALKLFASKGYAATSIREIIKDAGVTRPVVYYYFKNKEDLFCHLVEMHFERSYAEIDLVLREVKGCRARLKALIKNAFENAENSPETVQFLLRYVFAPPDDIKRLDSAKLTEGRFARIVEIMRQGLEDGEIFGGDAPSLALAFGGFMDLHVMAKSHQPESSLTPELGEALVELFLEGAASPRRPGKPLEYNFDFSE